MRFSQNQLLLPGSTTRTLAVFDCERMSQKGVAVTRQAIANKDVSLLKRCLDRFRDLNAGGDTLTAAIGECPISLFKETGLFLVIDTAEGKITLGETFTWEEVETMLKSGITVIDPDILARLLKAKESLGGNVVSCEKKEAPNQLPKAA